MSKKLTVYFDMDGVLADFDKAVAQMKHIDEKPWLSIKGFFRNLNPIGKPNDTVKALQDMGYTVYILTKVEIRDTTQRAMDKVKWVEEYLPDFDTRNIIIVPGHESKLDYIKSNIQHSVLLDDYKGNLTEWQKAGGVAVKFGFKWKEERPYYQITQDISQLIPVVESLEGVA